MTGLHPVASGGGPQTTPRAGTPSSIAPPGSRLRPPGSGGVAKPGSRVLVAAAAQRSLDPGAVQAVLKPYTDVADMIRMNLASPLGRLVDESRLAEEADRPTAITFSAFGLSGFEWPRAEVVARTAARIGRDRPQALGRTRSQAHARGHAGDRAGRAGLSSGSTRTRCSVIFSARPRPWWRERSKT